MAGDAREVRIEERLKIKIGEAKKLPPRSHGAPTHRDPYCVLSLDQEEIFRTSTIERTLNPFFGEEFQFEVPRRFRYLSIYVFDRDKDRHLRQDKVLGKVAIRREDLQSYNNKDNWFALRPVDADSEVQGKAHIEILFEESHPRITSISPDCHRRESSSPSAVQRSFDRSDGTRSPADEMTASNLSVDRKTSKAKNLSKNITEYCKESIKFGSCSSTSSKKLLSTVVVAENLTGLARSESLRGNALQSGGQGQPLHHTYGPASSRSRPDTLQVLQMHPPSDVYLSPSFDSNLSHDSYFPPTDHSPSDGVQHLTQPDLKNKLSIRVLECSELTMKNGQCDPYAVVTVIYSNDKKLSKRTKVKKKTVNPQFDECFVFDLTLENDSAAKERESGSNNAYTVWPYNPWWEAEACEVCVSLWHDAPGPLVGNATFLGEVRAPLRGAHKAALNTSAWYFLTSRGGGCVGGGGQWARGATPPGTRLSSAATASLGSLRLLLHHTLDRVLPPPAYEPLKSLLLRVPMHKPITTSAVYILGDIVSTKADAAQPLVRLFTSDDTLVPVIRALADAEVATLTDATTIFRGNTLVSKMMDEAMRLTGQAYLQHTLRPTLEQIFNERKPCEIDPTRVKDQGTVETNLANLKDYVEKMFDAITQSFIHCPAIMCRLFDALRQCAAQKFPRNAEVRYSVVSGFIFLRFFAPAILGPRLFDLTTEQIDPQTNRTLTLISKTIQSLGNLVSSQVCKEEYMVALYKCFCTKRHVQAIKRFLEIISSSTETQNSTIQDAPVLLKEGTMVKKAQGRKRFGRANLKQRHFRLTSCELSYAKSRGKRPLCSIPLADIVAARPVPEAYNLKMNNMFQIEYRDRILFVQAGNCVERKEWLDLLGKLCEGHRPPVHRHHPGSFSHSHWTCCSATKAEAPGCVQATGTAARSPPAGVRLRLDPARDLQRIHCLLYSHVYVIEAKLMPQRTGAGVQGAGVPSAPAMSPEELAAYQKTLRELKEVTYSLEQQHRAYQRCLARETKYGSKQAPIGDDNYLNLGARANMSPDGHVQGQLAGASPFRMYHSATTPALHPGPPKPPLPAQLSLAPDLGQLSLQGPVKSFTDSAYLNNSLYISSSTESVKILDANPEDRLSGRSKSGMGSGYLKMTSLKNEETLSDLKGLIKSSSSSNVRISPTRDLTKNERLTPPMTPQKPSCEYVEVRPRVPERDTKPIMNPAIPPKNIKSRGPTLEELADNPHCQEYELMSNFMSAAKNRLSADESENDDIPPAVPPRSHHNTPAKYPCKAKLPDKPRTDSPEEIIREHKCLEQYQLKSTALRIVEDGDIVQDRQESEEGGAQPSRSQNQFDLNENSDSENILRNFDSEVKTDDLLQCKRTQEITPLNNAAPESSDCQEEGATNTEADTNSNKKQQKPKEETGFFSRKSIQRKSIPIKSKPSSKKSNSVDSALGRSDTTVEPPKSQSALTDRLTPSFFKKKSKVSTDTVRLPPIC